MRLRLNNLLGGSAAVCAFALLATEPAAAQFTSNNVDQHSHLTLAQPGTSAVPWSDSQA